MDLIKNRLDRRLHRKMEANYSDILATGMVISRLLKICKVTNTLEQSPKALPI